MLPEAHMALAQVLFHRVRLRDALASVDRAIELDPSSAIAIKDRADILMTQGRVAEAAVSMRRAVVLDPQVPVIQADMSVIYMALGKIDSAIISNRRAIVLDSTNAFWYYTAANMFSLAGQRDSAFAACLRFAGDERYCRMLNDGLLDPSRRAPLLAYLGPLLQHPDPRIPPWAQALFYAGMGATDSAFARLRVAVTNGEQEFYAAINAPWMAPLKRDPRWDQIVGKVQRQ
jgi:tetratricopeptide (TPR) repeat protein